jgi:hypothetical protein
MDDRGGDKLLSTPSLLECVDEGGMLLDLLLALVVEAKFST